VEERALSPLLERLAGLEEAHVGEAFLLDEVPDDVRAENPARELVRAEDRGPRKDVFPNVEPQPSSPRDACLHGLAPLLVPVCLPPLDAIDVVLLATTGFAFLHEPDAGPIDVEVHVLRDPEVVQRRPLVRKPHARLATARTTRTLQSRILNHLDRSGLEAAEAPEAVEPEPEAIESAIEPYDLELPADVSPSRIAEWEPVLQGFGQAAAASGLPRPVAENLMQSYVDADAALGGYGTPVDIQGSNLEPYTPDDAERVLRSYWREGYDAQMTKVWEATSASPALREWLDDSGTGNDPRAIIALSMMGDLRLPKSQAQVELTKLMDPKSDYWSKDDWRRRPAVARVQLLTRIAQREDASVTHPQARAKNAEAQRAQETAAKNRAALQAEAAALVPKLDRGATAERAAAKKRFMDLTARL
jgi:hypothetical protein